MVALVRSPRRFTTNGSQRTLKVSQLRELAAQIDRSARSHTTLVIMTVLAGAGSSQPAQAWTVPADALSVTINRKCLSVGGPDMRGRTVCAQHIKLGPFSSAQYSIQPGRSVTIWQGGIMLEIIFRELPRPLITVQTRPRRRRRLWRRSPWLVAG
jgi:hypothetical protein